MRQFLLYFFLLTTILCFGQKNRNTIGFTENKGQIVNQKGKENKSVLYLLNTPGLNVQLKKNSFSYDIYETKKIPLTKKDKVFLEPQNRNVKKEAESNYSLEYNYHRIDIDFLNSNSNVQLIAEEKSEDYDNYYNISHAPQGITNVHKYQKITYNNIYNNIDAVFFIPQDTTKVVEYNFIVKPGGKISDIQLKFNGVKTVLSDNKIKMNVRFGQMEETLPLSWIEQGNIKKEIAVTYVNIEKNIYGFEGVVNTSDNTIIIDPVPVRLWGTFYGGSNEDITQSIFYSNNFLFAAGTTNSLTNIATSGTYQINYQGNDMWDMDSFIVKLNSTGNRIWGTYYGGNSVDFVKRIKVSNNNNVYIAGITTSNTNISSQNAFQFNHNNPNKYDGFISKFDQNGILQWGTYFGGYLDDYINSLSIDSNENIYIGGATKSIANISTTGSYQEYHFNDSYNFDAFISKFNSHGNLLWSSYYGGENEDEITCSTITTNNQIYFIGNTNSANNISTPTSYLPTLSNKDGFILKLDENGNRIFSTYLGGDADDFFYDLEIDSNNNLYSFGKTTSRHNIGTSNAFIENYVETPRIPDENGCIIKLNENGNKIWGTYSYSNTRGASVTNQGSIYYPGSYGNGFNISTPDAYQINEITINSAGYLIKLNTNGQREWGTFYTGNGFLSVFCTLTATDNQNGLFLSGYTTDYFGTTNTNLTTNNTHQPVSGGGWDSFIVKFYDCHSASIASSNSPICIGQNLQLNASGGTNYSWTGPNGFTSTDQNPIITNVNATHSGQYSCTITGTGGCDNTLTLNVIVGDNTAPVPDISNLPIITGDCNTVITTIPTATDNCAGIITATTTSPLNYSTPGAYTIIWNYSDGNGNTSSQNQTVMISTTVLPTATSPQQFCIQQNATLNDVIITGQNIQWYDAQSGGNLLPSTTLLQNGMTYYASQTINGCESDRILVTINIQNTSAPTGNLNQSFCSSQNATLNNIAISGTNINWYNSLTGNTILSSNTLLTDNTTYYATQTVNNCESLIRLAVTVTLINTLNANDYSETICDDLNNSIETINLSNYNSNLIATTSGNTFTYYHSQNGAENQIGSDEINNFSNYNLSIGNNIVFVRIDSTNSCHQVVMLNLNLVSKPIITITDIMPICEGSSITVNAGTGFDSYLWSTSETSQSINISTPGNYSVTVTKNHGGVSCTSVKNFTVTNSNTAIIHEIITSDWTSNQNTISVLLTTNSNGDYLYSIDGINYQTSNTFSDLTNGEYTVFVKDNNGCGITSQEVYLLMYPHFFTPNEDGYNDAWKIEFSEIEPNLTIKIFNRFGKLLKELDSSSKGWNGTYLGQPLPSDDYWFVVKRNNGKEFRGHFALKR